MTRSDVKREGRLLLFKPLLAILVLSCLFIGAFLVVSQYYINAAFEDLEKQYRAGLINIVSVAQHTIEPILNETRTGRLSRQEAVQQIRQRIRTMTYEDQYGKNYIFMSAYDGTILVQPFEPEKELTNQWDLQDAKGLYIIRKLASAAKTSPTGSFVRYHYHLPGVHRHQEKLAYVVGLPELDCFIGTGMYMEQSLLAHQVILTRVKYASLWLLLVVLLPIVISVIVILRRNRRLIAEIKIRRKAEEDAKISEAKYRSIFENVSKGIFQTTADGQLLNANDAFARICGYESSERIIGDDFSTSRHYADPLSRDDLLKRMNENGRVEDYVVKIKRKDGALIWVSISSRVVKDESGNILYYEGTIEDIHARKQAEEEVRRLAAIVRHSSELVNLCDPDGNMVFLNEAGMKMLGIAPRDIEKTNILQVIPDPLKPRVKNEICPALQQPDGSWEGELQYVNLKTNLLMDVHTIVFSIDDPDVAHHHYLVNISIDISEAKRIERKLKENEERLRGITSNLPGTVFQFYVDKCGKWGINYARESATALFDLSVKSMDEVLENFVAHIHPEDREKFIESARKTVENASSWDFQGRFIKDSGEVIWFHGLSTPTRQENRLVFNGIILDITQSKKAEEMLRLSEEKFTKIFMTTPDCIAITRMADGAIMDVNRGFEEITGWKQSEVIGKTSFNMNFWTNPDERKFMTDALQSGRDVLHREFQFRRKDGAVRAGIYSARSIEIANAPCLIFILNDMTNVKQLEEERKNLERQLSQSQKLDAIGQLASGVAHDFNNILMGIQGNAALVLMDYHPEHPHYQKLSRIEEHVRRGANLTRQLLGFAREGKYEVRTLSVNDLIRKVAQFFIETRKEIEATFQLQEGLYAVDADAGQIEQVLLNIFINAGHAMPGGGHLHLETCNVTLQQAEAGAIDLSPGNYIRMTISDTGIGMDENTLKRIFEPFFTTKLQKGGSGLGLASAYGIIRNHGGAVKAHSTPGKGSTFVIYLPSSDKKSPQEETASNGHLLSGSGGILLVDDEPMILVAASEMLKLLGYTVYQAASGQEALAVYEEKKNKIKLVLLDMILPGMSGSQVMQALMQINPQIRVILSSGYGMQGELQKVMDSGCHGFIQKPYTFTELSRMVHQVLQATNGK